MRAVITTTSGQVTWDSRCGPTDEMDRLIRDYHQWTSERSSPAFAVVSQDGAGARGGIRGVRVDFCDILSIEVER